MQLKRAHSTFHSYARGWLVSVHWFLRILDAHGKIAKLCEADIRVGSHALACPVPKRVFYVLSNVPTVMPIKIILLVHPTPGIGRCWSDKRVLVPGSCTIDIAVFAIGHAWLDAGTDERMQNGASLHKKTKMSHASSLIMHTQHTGW